MMKTPAVVEYGRSYLFETNWNLNNQTSQKIAAIITYFGALEYYVERAVWKLRGINPDGIRPETDGHTITRLISDLEDCANLLEMQGEKDFVRLWCRAARSGFVIRNNIAHGVATKYGDTLAYMRNPRWHGEVRNREFGDFWADENTLDWVSESLAVLLRIIMRIELGEKRLAEIASPLASKALREAQSILGEFSDQNYNPSFEKY